MTVHFWQSGIGIVTLLFAAGPWWRTQAQGTPVTGTACDSVFRGARVDSVAVTASAYLIRRDGEFLPPRVRQLLLESILAHFKPPQPLQLPVFAPGPAPLRMLRQERLGGDSLAKHEPVLYGVYDFTILRSGTIARMVASVPTMAPDFDARVARAIEAAAADSTPAVVARALDADAIALELRISTGPADARFRVSPGTVFTASFPRLRLVDARAIGPNPLPEYPEDERDEGRDGEVLLRVIVDASGAALIPTLEVVHATSPAFALAAERTLARYHFAPAHIGSCPVSQVMEIPFWFSLKP
jgi:hypothetical protein